MHSIDWTRLPFGLSDILSLVLVCRLVGLGLHSVYRIFCAFLVFEVLSTSLALLLRFSHFSYRLDYRMVWILSRIGPWILSVWMVYALLQAILANYPGILRISKHVLNIVLPLSLLIAVLTAVPEYASIGESSLGAGMQHLTYLAMILERVISTIALLVLLLMLFFILWFPVRMPRNLAVFSVGFVIYFSAKTSLMLLRTSLAHRSVDVLLSSWLNVILCGCLISWIVGLNREGELLPITLGHSWRTTEQKHLMSNLESINAVLARASRR